MVGRYGLCAYQTSVRGGLSTERSLSHCLKKYNVLIRQFWCGSRNATFAEKETILDSVGDKKLKSESICYANGSQEQQDGSSKPTFVHGSVLEYFNLSPSLQKSDEWRQKVVDTMLVYPSFISPEEETTLSKEIEPYISRLHYEDSHWDDAIHEYRETERSRWNKKNEVIINRIRTLAFPPGVPQLKLVHILDLAKKGIIKPHIDSVRFCGNTIAGLSLISDCIMRLKHDVQRNFFCDVYLPRYSLYVMKDFVRYEFTHEILGEEDSIFKGKNVPRERRVSIICRNEPENSSDPVPIFKPMD